MYYLPSSTWGYPATTKKLYSICTKSAQRPPLYKSYINVLCLLGRCDKTIVDMAPLCQSGTSHGGAGGATLPGGDGVHDITPGGPLLSGGEWRNSDGKWSNGYCAQWPNYRHFRQPPSVYCAAPCYDITTARRCAGLQYAQCPLGAASLAPIAGHPLLWLLLEGLLNTRRKNSSLHSH